MTDTPEPDDLDPEAGLGHENPPADLLELHEVIEWQAAIEQEDRDDG